MLPVQKFAALGAFVGFFLAGSVAGAADNPPADTAAQKALARDAVCTTCHNESWRVPMLSLYQTKHGNRADPKAPNCQSCHGQSTGHQQDPAGVHPDVVFGAKSKNVSSAEDRNGTCLGCHKTGLAHALVRQRARESGRVVQQLPYGAHCERPGAVQGDPARGLLRLPQDAACANAPDLDPSDRGRARWPARTATTRTARRGRSCWSRTRSTRPATPATRRSAARSCGSTPRWSTTARTAIRRTARPTRRCSRQRVPWLCQECHSGDHGCRDQQRRQSAERQRDDDQRHAAAGESEPAHADERASLPQLPRADPRVESSGGREIPAVAIANRGA